MATEHYCGWTITHDHNAPVTGRFRAERHGVGMCANNLKLLKRMIDTRIDEQLEEARKREREDQR